MSEKTTGKTIGPQEKTPWTQEEMTAWINRQDYQGLLSWWRFAPPGDPFFQGGTGERYSQRMQELKSRQQDGGAAASKALGWSSPREIPRR